LRLSAEVQHDLSALEVRPRRDANCQPGVIEPQRCRCFAEGPTRDLFDDTSNSLDTQLEWSAVEGQHDQEVTLISHPELQFVVNGFRAIQGSGADLDATHLPLQNQIRMIYGNLEADPGSGQERRCQEFGSLLQQRTE
jgi:hypothetical protein